MSQIRGGRADKLGNAFERLWVVRLALDVVEGRATAIRWEALGPEGAGVECEVRRPDGTLEKHQCRIENGIRATWSVADLNKVLVAAKVHLEADPNTRFVFVSRDPARVLSDLADRARSCDSNAKDFLDHCLTSKDHHRNYHDLCGIWNLQPDGTGDAQTAIGLLRRITFGHGIWELSEMRDLHHRAEAIAEGDGEQIVTFLGQHLEDILGETQRSDDLRGALRTAGYPPLDFAHDPRVPAGIERLQKSFREALEPHLIGSNLISRPEPSHLVEQLRTGSGSRLVFVTGDAGSGKSGVLLDAVRILREGGTPHLPIRLDTHYPDKAVRAFSTGCLGLPASPATCLRSLADGRRAVLIIDQLDAVRWTSANSDAGWELCKEIIDEALHIANVSVIVAGRNVDIEEDPRIQRWKKAKQDSQEIDVQIFNVGPMPEDAVASVVGSYGVRYVSLSAREKELLSNAQNLQLWWRLAEDGRALHFSVRAELLRSFWNHYRDKAVLDYQVSRDEVNGLLDLLIEFLDTNGRLDAPSILLDRHNAAASALRALGILHRTNGTTRFAHQSHLDYLTIERVFLRALKGGITPIDWLKEQDQSLFRRDQVRFLLQLLRDQDARLYWSFLEGIFFGDGIRFHIQHLALTTLAQASAPTEEEHAFIKRLWNEDEWHLHVLESVLERHEPWLDCLTEDDTIPDMLTSGDDVQVGEALLLCWRSADVAPEWFERVLAPHWDSGDPEWADRIGPRLARDPAHDTAKVFQWRLARARAGADQPIIFNADRLARRDQIRAIYYLAAIADGLLSNIEKAAAGDSQRRVEVDSERFKDLLEACRTHPRRAWDVLLPAHERAVGVHEKLRTGNFSIDVFRICDNANRIVSLLHDFLATSGASLLSVEGSSFLSELRTLGQPSASTHARKLAVDILAAAPESLADDAVDCLLAIERPLDVETSPGSVSRTDPVSAQDPAVAALRKLSGTCSAAMLHRIEQEVLAFHAARERNDVQWQLELMTKRQWRGRPNHYGLPQYALLLALPEDRLSVSGLRALRGWHRKFGDLRDYRDNGSMEVLPVVSPIPADKANLVSDKEWIKIVTRNWSEADALWREVKDGKYVEACPRSFASSLERAGQSNPSRCVRLGLRFPGDVADCYFAGLLRVASLSARPNDVAGDDWSPAPVHEVEALIAHIADRDKTEIAKAICRVTEERSGESWSDSTRDLLREYALHHPDPDGKSRPNSEEDAGGIGSLEMIVLNSVRCSAIRAASQLLWAHPDLLDWAKDVCERVIEDRHPAVRAASFDLVYAIGKHDLDLALSLLIRAYDGTDDAVLAIQHGPSLVRALWKREAELAPILQRALASSHEEVAELAAYWATVGRVVEGIYVGLAAQAASGGVAQRAGVVRALVDIAHHHNDRRAECLARLAPFMNDSDERVLDASNEIFRRDGFLDSREAPTFAEEFARSVAFTRDPSSLLHQLVEYEESLLPFVGAIEAGLEQLSGALLSSTNSMAHRDQMAGDDIATIMLRLYQQSEAADDPGLKGRCLDQWDALIRARVGSGREVLVKLDS